MIRKCLLLLYLFQSCSVNNSFKNRDVILNKDETYYISFNVLKKNNYQIYMSGIGKEISLDSLVLTDSNDFIESFYEQTHYIPNIYYSYEYTSFLNCLGFSTKSHTEEIDYYDLSEIIQRQRIQLEDSTTIIIKYREIPENMMVKIVDNFQDCIYSASNEKDVFEINSIKKIGVIIRPNQDVIERIINH